MKATALLIACLCVACASTLPMPAARPPGLAAFLGHHRGELRMYGPRGVTTVPMAIEVEPLPQPDRVRFLLCYGDGAQQQRRDYVLVLDDATTGRCHVDEQNGIVLAAWLADGELVSAFTVSGQTTIARYRATPDGIDFALESLATGEGDATGQGVTSHARVARQRAILRRDELPGS